MSPRSRGPPPRSITWLGYGVSHVPDCHVTTRSSRGWAANPSIPPLHPSSRSAGSASAGFPHRLDSLTWPLPEIGQQGPQRASLATHVAHKRSRPRSADALEHGVNTLNTFKEFAESSAASLDSEGPPRFVLLSSCFTHFRMKLTYVFHASLHPPGRDPTDRCREIACRACDDIARIRVD